MFDNSKFKDKSHIKDPFYDKYQSGETVFLRCIKGMERSYVLKQQQMSFIRL